MNGKTLKSWLPLAAVAAMAACSSRAQATLLTPGGGPTAIGTTAPTTVGAALADTTNLAVSTPDGTTGFVREQVYRDSSGGLDFAFQVQQTGGPGVTRLSLGKFNVPTQFTVDAEQVASFDNFAVGAKAADTADLDATGTSAGFMFNAPGLGVGTVATPKVSYVLIFKTNATQFSAGNLGVSDGGTQNFLGFAPSPEPTSLALLGSCLMGLCGVGLLRLRRRKLAPAAAV